MAYFQGRAVKLPGSTFKNWTFLNLSVSLFSMKISKAKTVSCPTQKICGFHYFATFKTNAWLTFQYTHGMHGTGILTFMNGVESYGKLVGKYICPVIFFVCKQSSDSIRDLFIPGLEVT